MFKLFVLSAVLAISAAAPSLEHAAVHTVATAPVIHKEVAISHRPLIQTNTVLKPSVRYETTPVETTHVHQPEPYIQKVGEVVEQIPTGVTHQSSSIVHNIAPVVKQVATQIDHKIVHKTPIFRENTIVKTVAAAPIVHTEAVVHAEPIVHAHGLINHFEHAPLAAATTFAAAPLAHASFEAAPLLHGSTFAAGWNAGALPLARTW